MAVANQSLKHNLSIIFYHRLTVPIVLLLLCLAITIQNVSLGVHHFWEGDYTHYNNYVIFKSSFSNLIENRNLYIHHPEQYGDLFKYSPSFALAMGFFTYLPDSVGLFFWNMLNVVVLYLAITNIKSLDKKAKSVFWFFVLIELINTTQFSQSNALLAGLVILAFNKLEKQNSSGAALFIAVGTFIKIFSVLGCLLFFLFPQKWKSFLWFFVWCALISVLPLLILNPNELVGQYVNWYNMLAHDYSTSDGMSAHLLVRIVTGSAYYKIISFTIGIGMLFIPLLFWQRKDLKNFNVFYLSLLLIWQVVFNHKSEASTFIIAVTGVGIWYFSSSKTNIRRALIILTFLVTSLWFTDLVPLHIREKVLDPNLTRVLLPTTVLLFVFYELRLKPDLSHNRLD